MKKFLALFLLLISCLGYLASAESLSNYNKKIMILTALDAVDNYEFASSVYNQESGGVFMEMFDDVSSKSIFCDIYSSQFFLEQISVKDYVSLFFNEKNEYAFTTYSVELKNVRFQEIYEMGGRWFAKVSLLKSLICSDKNYIYFPLGPQNRNSYDFELEITFVYEPDSYNSCKIFSIACQNTKNFEKISNFLVVQKENEKRDNNVLINGNSLTFNEFGQAYATEGQYSYPDEDVKPYAVLKDKQPNYNYITLGYKTSRFRARLRNEFAPLAYSCSGNTKVDKKFSWAYTIGADLGYTFPTNKNLRFGIYTGVAYSISGIDLKLMGLPTYSYILTTESGRHYHRTYDISSISQKTKSSDVMVPVYVSADWKINSKLNLSFDLGAKSYFNIDYALLPINVYGEVSGVYKDGTLVQDEVCALGHIPTIHKGTLTNSVFYREPIDFCIMGGVGVGYNIIDQLLSLHFKISYECGINKSYESTLPEFMSINDNRYPLTYSGVLKSDILMMSLVDCVSLRRNSLSFNLGLTVKF